MPHDAGTGTIGPMTSQYKTVDGALVGILMGSTSDWPTMKAASEMLKQLGIKHDSNVISAHRAPDRLLDYCRSAESRGLKILIAAAGGAAHLAGVIAANTHLPVLGCPMKAWSLEGLDSLLSMAQMPKGVPVATFAIGEAGAVNAALFAAAVLSLSDEEIRRKLLVFRTKQAEKVDEVE